MNGFLKGVFLVGIFTLVTIGTASTELLPRLGGMAVYDTDRDITWLTNPLAGAGSAFDDGDDPNDGLMSWQNANNWVQSLTIGNVSDWRLPVTPDQDDNCTGTSGVPSGFNCTASELGHLFHEELGGIADVPVSASSDPDLALFASTDVIAWSSIPNFGQGQAYTFNMLTGGQFTGAFDSQHAAWAVRSGDTATPIAVDIKPGSNQNSLNLCSRGAVPVAILGSESFDVGLVSTESLRFSEASVKVVGKKDPRTLCDYQDVNDDGYADLLCHYVTTDIAGVDGESSTATVNGELFDGMPIQGTDSVNIVKDSCD